MKRFEKAEKESTCQKDRQQERQEYNRTSTQPREEREKELFVRDGGKTEARTEAGRQAQHKQQRRWEQGEVEGGW